MVFFYNPARPPSRNGLSVHGRRSGSHEATGGFMGGSYIGGTVIGTGLVCPGFDIYMYHFGILLEEVR